MTIQPSYGSPQRQSRPQRTPFDRAVLRSIVYHIIVCMFTAMVLDGGVMSRICGYTSIGYWLGVIFIAMRRYHSPRKSDLAYISYGFPLLALCFVLLREMFIH